MDFVIYIENLCGFVCGDFSGAYFDGTKTRIFLKHSGEIVLDANCIPALCAALGGEETARSMEIVVYIENLCGFVYTDFSGVYFDGTKTHVLLRHSGEIVLDGNRIRDVRAEVMRASELTMKRIPHKDGETAEDLMKRCLSSGMNRFSDKRMRRFQRDFDFARGYYDD